MENLQNLIDKSTRITAYLEGDDTANELHPDHLRNLWRARSLARDIANAITEYFNPEDTEDEQSNT